MIFVEKQPEPADFGDNVRRRGERFLAAHPHPTETALSKHPYWRRAAKQLYDAYGGVCAYSCHWIAFDTGARTVDHFVPKSVAPTWAYEWHNFRLVCGRLNSRKHDYQDVLDPFTLKNGVFVIDFPSLLVKPSAGLSEQLDASAWATINRLQLNDETCTRSRLVYVRNYCHGHFDLEYLRECAPFLYREMRRQDLIAPRICEVMGIFRVHS